MYDYTFSKLANHQIRHHATYKVDGQPGDCMYSRFTLPQGLCGYVWVNILTLLPLRGTSNKSQYIVSTHIPITTQWHKITTWI